MDIYKMSKIVYRKLLLFEKRLDYFGLSRYSREIALSCKKKATYIEKKSTEKKELNPIIVKRT